MSDQEKNWLIEGCWVVPSERVNCKFDLFAFLKSDIIHLRSITLGGELATWNALTWLKIFSPRVLPVALARLAYFFTIKGMGPLGKIFSLINFWFFGIEISTHTFIGPGLVLPHTQGTVIGSARIGSNAIIFQGVTLGARALDMSFNEDTRPSVGDDVLIGAGAKILGGILLGDKVQVGANAVVLCSIPAGHVAVGVPAVARNKGI